MTGYELHNLLSENRELISDTWYFFLTVHLAVFGIVHIASRRVTLFERLTLFTAYCGFLYINFRAQTDNYALHEKITDRIQAEGGDTASLLPPPQSLWIIDNLAYIYLGVALLAALIILSTSWGRRGE